MTGYWEVRNILDARRFLKATADPSTTLGMTSVFAIAVQSPGTWTLSDFREAKADSSLTTPKLRPKEQRPFFGDPGLKKAIGAPSNQNDGLASVNGFESLSRVSKISAEEAEIRAAAEVGEVREDGFDLTVGETKPTRERAGILIDRGGRNKTACSEIVGLVYADDGVFAVDVLADHRAADYNVMTAPSVIGAIAVGCQCAAEVGSSEGGYLVS